MLMSEYQTDHVEWKKKQWLGHNGDLNQIQE